MTRIQVDPSLVAKLGTLHEPAAFCDAQGRVLGHYLPAEKYKELLYASYEILSGEELERRRAETGGSTLEEIWRELGRR